MSAPLAPKERPTQPPSSEALREVTDDEVFAAWAHINGCDFTPNEQGGRKMRAALRGFLAKRAKAAGDATGGSCYATKNPVTSQPADATADRLADHIWRHAKRRDDSNTSGAPESIEFWGRDEMRAAIAAALAERS